MATTIFIAVQCFKCSMMQVKQQKKSSNKWTCAVCNQKQFVRKVFARGYMAKDIRQFVQSFNMSQKDLDQLEGKRNYLVCVGGDETEVLNKKPKLCTNGDEAAEAYAASKRSKYMSEDDMEPKTCHRAMVNAGSKWREFLTEDEDEDEEQRRTHWPRATTVNTASKWNNYAQDDIKHKSSVEKVAKAPFKWDDYLTEDVGQQRTPRPTMAMGTSKQMNCLAHDDMAPMTCQEKVAKATSKWDDYMNEDDGEHRTQRQTTIGKSASKWNSYLTQEEELQLVSSRTFADHNSQWGRNGDFEIITHDQRVEDDIHPDFI